MRGAVWKFVMLMASLAALGIALFAAGGTSGGPGQRPVSRAHVQAKASRASLSPAPGVSPPAHIVVIVMENKSYGDVIGSAAAPFITSLAHRYALARDMYAAGHPSLPNYLALTGGSTFGISSDCTDCAVRGRSLANQLHRAGISWKAYMEGLPRPCFTGSVAGDGEYAKKHDPFMYYTQVVRDPALCAHVVPLMELGRDERSGTLPRFIWITPDLCHDMHDCGVGTGDRFLAAIVPKLLHSLGRNGLLFLTWDEGSDDSGCCMVASGGHIATIVAGPGARRGARLTTPSDHYSLLQTVEDLLRLPRLRGAACGCTPSLKPMLVGY